MSNCIKPLVDIGLSPAMFDYTRLKAAKDLDGNEVFFDAEGWWILRPADVTTIREFRHFLWEHVQPAVLVANARAALRTTEESDGFKEELTWTIKFLPPGTVKTDENWAQIF